MCVAIPPSHEQLGYLREPDRLWIHPPAAPRAALWDFLLLRWCYNYFDRTLNIMVRALSAGSTLSEENLMATMVLYHQELIFMMLPRVRLALEATAYCRDLHEYHELLRMLEFILRAPFVTDQDLDELPLEKLLYWGAGLDPHVQALSLRANALHVAMLVSNTALRKRLNACMDPELIPALCRILVDMPLDIHFVAILALSYCNLLIDINWDNHPPYLFELAMHVLLSASHSSTSFLLHAVLASHLLWRLAQEFPRRNIIETCFYALTNVLQQTRPGDTFRSMVEENIRFALTTNGNRAMLIELVALQEPEQQALWNNLFPSIKWPAPNNRNPVLVDALTEQPIVRAWHFEPDDTTLVSLETIIRHVALNGLRNPFTNLPTTWDRLLAANQNNL
jgi:hypothetical protein